MASVPVRVPLSMLLAAGAELSDAEIAYVMAEVAQALSQVHQSGQCHGAVGIAAVEVGALGQVILGAATGGPDSSMSAAEDIRGLIELFGELIRARPITASLAGVRVRLARVSATADELDAVFRPLAAESLTRLTDQFSRPQPHAQSSDNRIDSSESKSAIEAAAREPGRSVQARRAAAPPDPSPPDPSPSDPSPPALAGMAPAGRSGPGLAAPGLSPPVSRRANGASPPDRSAAAQLRRFGGYWRRPAALGVAVLAGCLVIWIIVGVQRGADSAVAASAANEPTMASATPTTSTVPPVPVPPVPIPPVPIPRESGPVGDRGGGGTSAPIDWITALASLDERRLAAFTAADSDQLKAVDMEGSAAMTNDLGTIAELRQRNVKPIGLQTSIESVRELARSPNTVTLVVADHRSGYELIDRVTGVTAENVSARGSQRWRVRLDHQDSGWLVTTVTAVSSVRPKSR